jgi:hypothetical protein
MKAHPQLHPIRRAKTIRRRAGDKMRARRQCEAGDFVEQGTKREKGAGNDDDSKNAD